MDELRDLAGQLRGLAGQRYSPERSALVRAALESRWEGIQSVALKTLGRVAGRADYHPTVRKRAFHLTRES